MNDTSNFLLPVRTAEKPVRSRRRYYAVGAAVIVAALIAVVIFFRDRNSAPNQAPPLVPVTAAVASRHNVPEVVSALGTVASIDSVSVQAQVNGPIIKIEFSPGQEVKQGQELFLIDPRPYQAALNEQQAQLSHDEGVLAEAQVDLTRYQLLAQQNSIAKQQSEDQVYVVEQDKGTVQLDQANVETAQLNLQYCHVLAPISGRAGVLMVDLGNLVGPDQGSSGSSTGTNSSTSSGSQAPAGTMVQIAQTKPIYLSFNIPQILLDRINHNQAASPLEVDAYSQAGALLEKGKLTVIDNQVNTGTGTVLMQATFDNADEKLWPGEFVRAKLILSIRNNVVTVPSQAVSAGPNGSYVYVINSDSTVHRVDVEVTDRQDTVAVIAKGLSGGEKIVVDGQYRLDNGVKVDVQQMVESAVE
jgi:membrane fusion protein, multidrug efflux system